VMCIERAGRSGQPALKNWVSVALATSFSQVSLEQLAAFLEPSAHCVR